MAGFLDTLWGGQGNAGSMANQIWQSGQFQPYTVNNPGGQISFNGTTANSSLTPEQQQLQNLFQGQINSNFGNGALNYSPNTSFLPQQYQNIFGNFQNNVNSQFQSMQQAMQPQIDRYLQSNLDNEFSKGTLASTAGQYQTAGAQEAVNNLMKSNYSQAFQNASQLAGQQFGAAQGTANLGEQQAEFGPQYAMGQTQGLFSNIGQQNQFLANLINQGSSLGAARSAANVNAGLPSIQTGMTQDQAQAGLLSGLLFGSAGQSGGLLGSLLGGGSSSGGQGGVLGQLGSKLTGQLGKLFGGGATTGTGYGSLSDLYSGLFGNSQDTAALGGLENIGTPTEGIGEGSLTNPLTAGGEASTGSATSAAPTASNLQQTSNAAYDAYQSGASGLGSGALGDLSGWASGAVTNGALDAAGIGTSAGIAGATGADSAAIAAANDAWLASQAASQGALGAAGSGAASSGAASAGLGTTAGALTAVAAPLALTAYAMSTNPVDAGAKENQLLTDQTNAILQTGINPQNAGDAQALLASLNAWGSGKGADTYAQNLYNQLSTAWNQYTNNTMLQRALASGYPSVEAMNAAADASKNNPRRGIGGPVNGKARY